PRGKVVPKRPPPKLKKDISWSAVPWLPGGFKAWFCWLLLTLEFKATNPNTLRRLSGSSTVCRWSTSEEMLALEVLMRGADAVTVISWVRSEERRGGKECRLRWCWLSLYV